MLDKILTENREFSPQITSFNLRVGAQPAQHQSPLPLVYFDFSLTDSWLYFRLYWDTHKSGVGKVRPASFVDLALVGSSVLTLNPTRVLPPNAPKDELLFSRWMRFSRTLSRRSFALLHSLTLTVHLTRSVTSPVGLTVTVNTASAMTFSGEVWKKLL